MWTIEDNTGMGWLVNDTQTFVTKVIFGGCRHRGCSDWQRYCVISIHHLNRPCIEQIAHSAIAWWIIARTAFLKSAGPLIAQKASNHTARCAASTIASVGRVKGWSAAIANRRKRARSSSNLTPSALAMALAI